MSSIEQYAGRPRVSWTSIDHYCGEDKIVDLDTLDRHVQRARAESKTVVLANGCFDLLHAGHVHCLEGAKRHGDILIVALNGDASMRRLKGPGRPIMPQHERALLIAALRCTDYVVIFDDDQPIPLLQRIQPDVHAKGTDYTEETVPERDVVLAYGGRVAITGDAKRPGSRGIVATILERYGTREG